ncbi:hypothetical protein EBB07_16215 [Paenibacillaceae bacterium]|nr:hypothetical protein EBB07_16215 [Paenibacillaceae bacterium]
MIHLVWRQLHYVIHANNAKIHHLIWKEANLNIVDWGEAPKATVMSAIEPQDFFCTTFPVGGENRK